MSKEIRIPSGDSRILKFEARNASDNNWMDSSELSTWNISFETESLLKTSVDNPSEVYTSQDPSIDDSLYINVLLLSTETDHIFRRCGRDRKAHYKLSLYKENNPPVIVTGSMGDLIFIEE
jgi:hypothetical protein